MSSANFVKTMFKLCPRFVDKTCFTRHFRDNRRLNIFETTYNSYYIEKKIYTDNKRQSRKNTNSYFLFGGFFTLFGLLKSGEEKEEEPEYITAMKRSILLTQRGEFKKAEQMLHLALRQAQTIQHFKAITYIYDLMANLAFEVGDLEKAEKLFVSVMQRLISTGTPQDDLQIIHMSLKIAKIYEAKGDFQKAEDGYKFCLQALKKNPDDNETNFFWLMTLDWYAHMLIEQSKEPEAYKMLLEAYELSIQINGVEHEQTITILNDLGTIDCRRGDYNMSIKHLSQAVEAGKKLDEFDLSPVHINLGFTYIKKELYEEARKSCKEGQVLAKIENNQESLNEASICLEEIKKLSTCK